MTTCPKCRRDVIQVTTGKTTLLLDPVPQCYGAVEEHHIYPEEGDRVFLSTALVVHFSVCPVEIREKDHRRTLAKEKQAKQPA